MPDNNNNPWQSFLTGQYQTGVDPFTQLPVYGNTGVGAATGIGSVVGGVMDLIGSKGRIDKYQNQKRKAGQRIRDFYNQAEAGAFNYTLDPGFGDVYEMSKTKTSRDPFDRATATGLSALEGGGTRALLAGVSPFMQNMAAGETQLGLTDLQREMSGLQQYSAARQGITAQNEALRNQLAMRQLEQNELAKATAKQNIAQERQARRDAWGNIASGVVQTGLAAFNPGSFFNEEGGRVPEKFFGGGILMDAGLGSFGSALGERALDSFAYTEKGFERRMKKAEQEAKLREAGGLGGDSSGQGMADIQITVNKGGQSQTMKNGGMMKYQMGGDVLSQILGSQGGAPQGGGLPPVQGPLPGPASHEKNPIHMMNDNGEKVGEAMGGEFVINNEQASEMTDEYKEIKAKLDAGEKIGEEEWMELFKTIDGIFGQPQFDDSEMPEQQMA